MANNKTQKKKQRRSRHNGGTKTPSKTASKTASKIASKIASKDHPLLTEAKSLVGKGYLVREIRKILNDSTMTPVKREEALAQKKILVDLAKRNNIRAYTPHTPKIGDQANTPGYGAYYTANNS
jgi:hypothetical protein